MGTSGFDMINRNKENRILKKRTKERYVDSRSNLSFNENIYKYVESKISEEERKVLDLKIQSEIKQIKKRANLMMYSILGFTLFLTISFLIWMMI